MTGAWILTSCWFRFRPCYSVAVAVVAAAVGVAAGDTWIRTDAVLVAAP